MKQENQYRFLRKVRIKALLKVTLVSLLILTILRLVCLWIRNVLPNFSTDSITSHCVIIIAMLAVIGFALDVTRRVD